MTPITCPNCKKPDSLSVDILVDPNSPFPAGLAPGETYGFDCGRCGIQFDYQVPPLIDWTPDTASGTEQNPLDRRPTQADLDAIIKRKEKLVEALTQELDFLHGEQETAKRDAAKLRAVLAPLEQHLDFVQTVLDRDHRSAVAEKTRTHRDVLRALLKE